MGENLAEEAGQAITGMDPGHIMAIASGYGVSRALITAVGIGLYTRLAGGSMTLDEVADAFGLVRRPAMDSARSIRFSVDLLERDGDGTDARYRNTPATAAFLDKAQPGYIGGIIEVWDRRNYRFWSDLTEALETGRPQNETKHAGTPFFETLSADPALLEAFMQAMHGSSVRNFKALAKAFPFERVRTLTDVGGADALLSRTVAAAHPHLRCTSFDLPAVTQIARRRIDEARLSDRIEPVVGDFFNDPLPPADVITMGMVLHDWNLERKKIRRAKSV